MKMRAYAAACPKFAESQRMDPATGTLMNLAACHEEIGKTAAAWFEFRDALSLAMGDSREDRIQEVQRRIAKLEPRLARVAVVAEVRAPGLEIRVDGVPRGDGSGDAAIVVDPGPHSVMAMAPGRLPWTALVEAKAASIQKVDVPELALDSAPPPLTAAGASPPVASSAKSAQIERSRGGGRPSPSSHAIPSPGSYALGGLGVVAIGFGGYFGLQAAAKKKDSQGDCQIGGCSQKGADLLREARTAAWESDVAFGVGIAAIAGAAFWFWSSSRTTKPAVSWCVAPTLAASSINLAAFGTW